MSIVRFGMVAVAVLAFGTGSGTARAGDREHEAGIRSTDTTEDHHWEALRIERDYRHRVARLHRLRELAAEQRDADRQAELDRVHDELRAAHAERMAEVRRHMDKPALRRLDEALADRREQAEPRAEKSRDRRDHRRDHRAEHRESATQHREDRRQTRHDRREVRGDARDRAEQHWLDARDKAAVTVHPAAHMHHAASRLAEKRWREEARDRSAQRWERAVRRSGMLGDVPPSRNFRVPGQQELDDEVRRRISDDDLDREFERLLQELERE